MLSALNLERATERATALWNKLHDAFGESLSRKFGTSPPDLWIELVHSLKDSDIERGLRRLMAGGRREVPALPEFRRLCVGVADDSELAPSPVPLLEAAYTGDNWEVHANLMLLDFIFAQAREKKRYFSPEQTRRLTQAKKDYAADMRDMSVYGRIEMKLARQWFTEHVTMALKDG